MNGLSRTIDSTIGKNHVLSQFPLTIIVIAVTHIVTQFRTGLIGIGIGKDLRPLAIATKEALAFRVSRQKMGLLSGQTRILTHSDRRFSNRLSGRSLHYHKSRRPVGL